MDDHDRPLNARGQRNAPAMGRYMRAGGHLPDVILCSTARRTVETLGAIVPYIGENAPVKYERELYMASAAAMLSRIKSLPADCKRALLVAHNPGMEELADEFVEQHEGAPNNEDLRRLQTKYPTGALSILQFDVDDWSNVKLRSGVLKSFTCPRDL